MKKRLLSVLAFALTVSAGAAFVLYQLISSKVTTVGASTKPVTAKVFVAARDLELGALITEKDVKTQEFLEAPSGAILKKEDIVGRGVTNPIHRDSSFYDGFLAPKGGGAGFAATIPQGMRAFAVHVNDVVGVAGFAVAGMRVDILVSGSIPGATTDNAGAVTRTLLQNIQVLSAGQNYQKDAEGKPVLVQVVNLLVTPAQAEILNLATEQSIQLVLRNPADKEIVTTPGATTYNLFTGGTGIPLRQESPRSQSSPNASGNNNSAASLPVPDASMASRAHRSAPSAAAPAPAVNTVTVEVYSGSKREESTFADPDKRTTVGKQ
jgi:pilus assembly protein CpaB